MSDTEVEGLRELGEFMLKTLPDALTNRYLARATFAAAQPFQAHAISTVRVRTGNVQSHIHIFKKRTKGLVVEYDIGVSKLRLSAKERKVLRIIRRAHVRVMVSGDPYYWYYLERGTAKMPAYPFLRPSFDSMQDHAIAAFAISFEDSVNKVKSEARWS